MTSLQTIADSLRAATLRLVDTVGHLMPGLIAAALAMTVFWTLARFAWRGLLAADRFVGRPTMARAAAGLSFWVIVAAGVVVSLDVLGVNAQSLATGLGLGGVALGFALRDIVSNLVAGLLIISSQEFHVGDQIVVADTEGTVERIELRATYLRTYDGRMVIVPNALIYSSKVTNNTESPFRRASVMIHLGYRQDLELALRVILDAVTAMPHAAPSPPPSMRVLELSPNGIQIEARFWTESKRVDFSNAASAAREAIVEALKRRGIGLPDGSVRVVSLQNASGPVATREPDPDPVVS